MAAPRRYGVKVAATPLQERFTFVAVAKYEKFRHALSEIPAAERMPLVSRTYPGSIMKFAYFARPRVADGSPPSPMLGRTATALGIAAGCYAITMAVLGTTISLFLADAVRVGPELIGLYFTGCAVAAIAINLAAGWLSDRLADRRVALAATALAGVAGALIFIEVRNYAVVFATGAVLLGLNDAYISQLFAYVKEFAESTGREVTPFSSAVRSVFSAGWVIGPPVGFLLLTQIGFGLMYAGAAALLLLTALLGRWFLPALPSPPGPTAKDNADGRSSGLRRVYATVPRRTWLLLGSVTAVNVANQIYLINIALYVTGELHLSAAPVGLMAGTCAALEIPLMITVGRLADRIGKMRVMAAALVVAVMFFCLLPVVRLRTGPHRPAVAERRVDRGDDECPDGGGAARGARRRPAPHPRSTRPPSRLPNCWPGPSPGWSLHRRDTETCSGSAPVSSRSPSCFSSAEWLPGTRPASGTAPCDDDRQKRGGPADRSEQTGSGTGEQAGFGGRAAPWSTSGRIGCRPWGRGPRGAS